MICTICGKNQATIHFKGVFSGQVVKMYLCDVCARKKGICLKTQFSISDLISAVADVGPAKKDGAKKTLACPACGLKYSEFKSSGRFGCADCYNTFGHYLPDLLQQIHGKTKHTGKKTAAANAVKYRANEPADIESMKKELDDALAEERYERAAEIRDKIEELQDKGL